ncbi:hypothetical protein IAT38_006407 [Cryptococcus sp. DSM 104549]
MPPSPNHFFSDLSNIAPATETSYSSTLLAYGFRSTSSATQHGLFGRHTDVLAPIAVLLMVCAFAFGFVALFHCWADRRVRRAAQTQSGSSVSLLAGEEGNDAAAAFLGQENGQPRRLKRPALTIAIPGKSPRAERGSSATFYLA